MDINILPKLVYSYSFSPSLFNFNIFTSTFCLYHSRDLKCLLWATYCLWASSICSLRPKLSTVSFKKNLCSSPYWGIHGRTCDLNWITASTCTFSSTLSIRCHICEMVVINQSYRTKRSYLAYKILYNLESWSGSDHWTYMWESTLSVIFSHILIDKKGNWLHT